MTNSDGIITGMPPKATVAGGASDVLGWQSSAMSGWGSSTLSTVVLSETSELPSAAESTESYNFVPAASSTATSAPYTGGAAGNKVAGTSVVLMLAGALISLFL